MTIAIRRARNIALAALAGWACLQPIFAKAQSGTPVSDSDWALYGGNGWDRAPAACRNHPRQCSNSSQPAWTVRLPGASDLETHPLAVGGVVYAYTPELKVIALDGATGKQLWQFDSGIKGQGPQRGLAWWTDGKEKRLFASVMNNLYALDPDTGKPLAGFGKDGRIDLMDGLRGRDKSYDVSLTSPGTIYKNLIITGFRTAESAPAAPGDIRAFDVHSGKLVWTFHTIPHPGEFGYATLAEKRLENAGAANNLDGMDALDRGRGIVYVPTGSAVDDFYGASRIGDNLFANTLLALDARTGKRLWHFQGVHHDVNDRDFPTPPVLLTLMHDGKPVDAVAQPTKQGFLFVLDRVTGKPLFPVTAAPIPRSDVPGEATSPVQPSSAIPAPYARQHLGEDTLTARTPQAHAWALDQFQHLRNDGPFAPMRVGQQTIVFPGFDGGAEWGGPAADPNTGVIYINANEMAWTGGLVERAAVSGRGAVTYQDRCAGCHGPDRQGAPPTFPALSDVAGRLTPAQIADKIHTGGGRMPAFADIQGETLAALQAYLVSGKDDAGPQKEVMGTAAAKYRFTGYRKFP